MPSLYLNSPFTISSRFITRYQHEFAQTIPVEFPDETQSLSLDFPFWVLCFFYKLVHFVEQQAGSLIDGSLVLKLNSAGFHYVNSRFEALLELESLLAGAPVDYLRAYVSDLGDHRALEQLRRILRLLTSLKAEINKDPPQCDDPGERRRCTSLDAARLDSERSCGRCLTTVQKGRSSSDLALCLTVQLRNSELAREVLKEHDQKLADWHRSRPAAKFSKDGQDLIWADYGPHYVWKGMF